MWGNNLDKTASADPAKIHELRMAEESDKNHKWYRNTKQ
jgi:hypothetical protein